MEHLWPHGNIEDQACCNLPLEIDSFWTDLEISFEILSLWKVFAWPLLPENEHQFHCFNECSKLKLNDAWAELVWSLFPATETSRVINSIVEIVLRSLISVTLSKNFGMQETCPNMTTPTNEFLFIAVLKNSWYQLI